MFDPRALTRDAVTPVVAGLVGLAVAPVFFYVGGQLTLQFTLSDDHAALHHYTTMSYYGLSIVALGALAALGNRGHRPAAYGAGLLAAILGVASLFQPTASALGPVWSGLAVLWALALVGAYEWSVTRNVPRPRRSGEEPPTPT